MTDEFDRLLHFTERDLPAGRHQLHRERLMTQIHEDIRTSSPTPASAANRRNPFLRRAILIPVAAFALVGAVVTGVQLTAAPDGSGDSGLATGPLLVTEVGSAHASGATQLLNRIALAANETSTPKAHEGQYVYIESTTAGTHVRNDHGKSTVVSDKLHPRQTWKSLDGKNGWLIEAGATDTKGITLDSDVKPYLNAPSYNYLAALTTDPDALLAKIYNETRGEGRGPDQEAFTTIGDLLGESYPTAALTSALYKAAAKIPGVVTVDDAVDAAGRHGVAVARLDETSGQRDEWIFDNKTLTFLGKRTVQVNPVPGDTEANLIKPGTVVFTTAITTRAIVDGIKQTPAQQTPARAS
ncbi:CU044_5270 family protein [Kitasatospora sp. NPDC085895]|uniref:CU044_5270 family protein n=1 Tax=Kitasatospora sp. NPDC085895 TaxID=3155057 RepID=UPI00344CAF34